MKKIIVANWKMHPETLREARALVASVRRAARGLNRIEVVVCPPVVFLAALARSQSPHLSFGAQDAFWDKTGPYTGETSPTMLRYAGADYVILGHSERRALGETNEAIGRKLRRALGSGLRVILCVGERERDREGRYLRVLEGQVLAALAGAPRKWAAGLSIAYEPIWAVGIRALGADTPAGFLEQAIFIKKVVSKVWGKETALALAVLYGGSVDERNVETFITDGEAAGLLVGRVSLEARQFLRLLAIVDHV